MPAICNSSAIVTCPHEIGVAVVVPSQFKVMVGGSPALKATDPSTFVLAGCPQTVAISGDPSWIPCIGIVAPPMGSTKVMITGIPAMLDTATMMTNGVPVSGPAGVTFAEQLKVQASG